MIGQSPSAVAFCPLQGKRFGWKVIDPRDPRLAHSHFFSLAALTVNFFRLPVLVAFQSNAIVVDVFCDVRGFSPLLGLVPG